MNEWGGLKPPFFFKGNRSRMREILPLLNRPTHYLGTEPNSVHKDPAAVDVRVALAFPDLYEVGMSYIGQKILAHAVNRNERFWAERVFAPAADAIGLLRGRGLPLCTLESDTPLGRMDVVAFSLTHELCYTNVLLMLDLAGIPLHSAERTESWPLVIAGGGCAFNAEPVADFLDLLVLGDGEEVLVQILERVELAKQTSLPKSALLRELSRLPGVYVPAYFKDQGPGRPLEPLHADHTRIEKRIVPDLNSVEFPAGQIVPFGKVIHDRLTLEIARGCTRGCRFCQAGMLYRPVRERSLKTLGTLLEQGLDRTGFEEVSFLSLSTGDFSALTGLFEQSISRCSQEQVSISLPSLRVGSLDPQLMSLIASIRRTGVTLAPEAGSQRLRDVINKGITEEDLLAHVTRLFGAGWQVLKLYFMIGLPTETRDDLDAILDLCLKVQGCAGKGARRGRLQINVGLSPFVPKPHTPFQWDRQLSRDEASERLGYLMDRFRPHRRFKLKWHDPDMSFLEGIFSRGDRALAPLVERAYREGGLFSSWAEHLQIDLWKRLMNELSIDPQRYLGERKEDEPLPWDHLDSGVSKQFLLRERGRALAVKTSPDCRYHPCLHCGVCTASAGGSRLTAQAGERTIAPMVNLEERDQGRTGGESSGGPVPGSGTGELHQKRSHFRIWYAKLGPAGYLSQLELQKLFERAFRRADLPLAFSGGFHPLPLLSFGRALPVGVESREEWLNIMLREEWTGQAVFRALEGLMPEGMSILRVEELPLTGKQPQPRFEDFLLVIAVSEDGEGGLAQQELHKGQWENFLAHSSVCCQNRSKKGVREVDIRPLVQEVVPVRGGFLIRFDWHDGYLSPLRIISAVLPDLPREGIGLTKMRQWMVNGAEAPEMALPSLKDDYEVIGVS
jgi:radical SAM family uncharacterized protein/radical SAM-linked protein